MEIRTRRLCLRPIGPWDLESACAYAMDPEATRYMAFLPVDSVDEARQFLADADAEWKKPEPAYREFAILLDGVHVGGMSLYPVEGDPEALELGWILRRDRWRQGIAFEAAEALMDWARTTLGARRFIAQCDAENAASYHLMEKLGMRRVSCLPGRKNRSSDEERFELTYAVDAGDAESGNA